MKPASIDREQRTRDLEDANLRLTIQYAVTRILSDADNLGEAIRKIGEFICVQLHWDCGAFWEFDAEGRLRCQQFWEVRGASLDLFRNDTRNRAFRSGEGVPGMVVMVSGPVWIEHLAKEAGYVRAEAALASGLASIMSFPVLVHGKVIGVLEFNSKTPAKPDPDRMKMFEGIGSQIGQFMLKRKAEALLKWSEDRWKFALEGSQQGVWDWNTATDQVFYSRQWKAILGFSDEEIGQSIYEWHHRIHPADLEMFQEALTGHVTGERSFYTAEYRMICRDGSYKWIFDRGLAVERDQNGRATRVIGTHEDITERRKIEQMKNEFISTVSHELRTPLSAIRGSLGLLDGGVAGPLPEKAGSLVHVALTNCERLVRLVNDILDIDRIESGRLRFAMKSIDLMELIDHAIEANRSFALTYRVSLEHRDRLDHIMVRGDPDRLHQVLTNVISNAVKFSPKGELVVIRTCLVRGKIRVEVVDRGPGIPEEFRSRIFLRFAQADSSDTRQRGGSGLGLAISKAIVQAHGGEIGFTTEMGRGTTFYFDLPMSVKSGQKEERHEQETESTLRG